MIGSYAHGTNWHFGYRRHFFSRILSNILGRISLISCKYEIKKAPHAACGQGGCFYALSVPVTESYLLCPGLFLLIALRPRASSLIFSPSHPSCPFPRGTFQTEFSPPFQQKRRNNTLFSRQHTLQILNMASQVCQLALHMHPISFSPACFLSHIHRRLPLVRHKI